MNNATLGLVLVIVGVVGIIAVAVRVALSEHHSKVSKRILETLQRTRLFRMLERRQVDVWTHVQQTKVAQIRQRIATCEACPSTSLCDSVLAGAEVRKDFSFCPNDAAIAQAKGL
jgi:Family of unknown function (DUF6455)